MILKGFKEKSNKKYIQSVLKNQSKNTLVSKIEHVLLILHFKNPEELNTYKPLVALLEKEFKKIVTIGFSEQFNSKTEFWLPCYSKKDIGFGSTIKNAALKKTLSTKHDAVIGFYEKDLVGLNLINLKANAEFRIGLVQSQTQINDLSINTSTSQFDVFIKELKKYLQILKIK